MGGSSYRGFKLSGVNCGFYNLEKLLNFTCCLERSLNLYTCTVEPVDNGHPGAELSGRCRKFSIRVKCMDRRTVGKKNPGCGSGCSTVFP